MTNGHWWYSNTPTFIEHDLAARLEAVPRTKQIGYYSDMYKLEFALPKFAMYKRILAKMLAERFVIDRGWSEEQAVELGTQVLRGNVETDFPLGRGFAGRNAGRGREEDLFHRADVPLGDGGDGRPPHAARPDSDRAAKGRGTDRGERGNRAGRHGGARGTRGAERPRRRHAKSLGRTRAKHRE